MSFIGQQGGITQAYQQSRFSGNNQSTFIPGSGQTIPVPFFSNWVPEFGRNFISVRKFFVSFKTGDFYAGQKITGTVSGAEATVLYDSVGGAGLIYATVPDNTVENFILGEIITQGTSSATIVRVYDNMLYTGLTPISVRLYAIITFLPADTGSTAWALIPTKNEGSYFPGSTAAVVNSSEFPITLQINRLMDIAKNFELGVRIQRLAGVGDVTVTDGRMNAYFVSKA